MTDLIIKLFAFAMLTGFLAILFIWVPRIDLAIILGSTLILVFIDFFLKTPKKD